MRILVDTNILLRSSERKNPQFDYATASIALLVQAGRIVCISSQSIYEFLAVATKPTAENGLGLAHIDAIAQLTKLLSSIEVFYDSPAIAADLRRLVVTHKVTGKKIHDARMVATMNVQRIPEILTFNGKDFTRYLAITILSPSAIARGQLPASPPSP